VQNLAEFWNVSTRPESDNGHGISTKEAMTRLQFFERSFTIFAESRQSYRHWKELIERHDVHGKQAHDTRLVGIMLASGIGSILTFNTKDFVRFPEIITLHPDQVLAELQ